MPENQQLEPITVSELLNKLNLSLKNNFKDILVVGELSGFKVYSSGHAYFSLKDKSDALVKCVMFHFHKRGVNFVPKDGLEVSINAEANIYFPRGDLQLVVSKITEHGRGSLYEQFEALKRKLDSEGVFNKKQDRPLPLPFVRSVGVVSSLGAAALHDVLTTLKRRTPHINITIYPSLVQGETAPEKLILALLRADQENHDAILLVRGGGSIEDLWAFNDEKLARTISELKTFIISGVGHEVDFTISDLVANHRAPTPTAAAEIVSQSTMQYLNDIGILINTLHKFKENQINNRYQKLDILTAKLVSPEIYLKIQTHNLLSLKQSLIERVSKIESQKRTQLKDLQKDLNFDIQTKTRDFSKRLALAVSGLIFPSSIYAQNNEKLNGLVIQLQLLNDKHRSIHMSRLKSVYTNLNSEFEKKLMVCRNIATQLISNLKAYNPKGVLSRGFSIVYDSEGKLIKSAHEVGIGDLIKIEFVDSELQAEAISKNN